MKIKIHLFLLLIMTLAGIEAKLYAQSGASKIVSCQPTLKEISAVVNSQGIIYPPKGVLIVGEIGAQSISTAPGRNILLIQLIAMSGGLLKTAVQPVYLVRHSAKNNAKIIIKVDINEIKKGEAEDIELKGGDLIYVSRGCVNGKLLPPTRLINILRQPSPGLLDSPITNRIP